MDHLIAKLKGVNGPYKKVLSNTKIFSQPDLSETRAYEAGYKPEEEEWLEIREFSKKDFFIDFLGKPFSSTEYPQLPEDKYKDIEFLCSVQDEQFFFQKMAPSMVLNKKFFQAGSAPTLMSDKLIIVINNSPDAVYDQNLDVLYFKRLSSITTIFKGIDVIYREATDTETENFLKSTFLKLDAAYDATKVKTANRKRIAMVIDTLKSYSTKQKSSLFKYIGKYCNTITYDKKSEQFTVNNEEELKQILFGIEERYYTTEQGKQKRLANSIIPL
ncbi:hypothetical protein [Mucilaginibacter sp. OK098]|uniref:hypothetical protein n=1 Tax=Mucilaginibacter sp. OK098 TaxID=1855297 RepID=UPI0009215736|nr:hypothetical protein [Mucilaginibacter sp. OK098]SHL96340.1 hypothetical protein SAMN05216524_101338 [Mucilaginibacter sp. OK098]